MRGSTRTPACCWPPTGRARPQLESGRNVVPAAEWLLDNYHLVEAQIREIRSDLPPGDHRQLPKLASGPFAGYPRVFHRHGPSSPTPTATRPHILRRFIQAYQRIQPLTIGELWAVAITLRIVLIENLRRLADQITVGAVARADAETLAGMHLAPGHSRSALDAGLAARHAAPLSEIFAAQLAKRLRDQDPRTTPPLHRLEERLGRQGLTIDEVVQHALHRQGASNVTVRNIITRLRSISDMDWAVLFESVSLVDERLRAASDFASMDFPTPQPLSECNRGTGPRLAAVGTRRRGACARGGSPRHSRAFRLRCGCWAGRRQCQ